MIYYINNIKQNTYQEIIRLYAKEFPEVPECYRCICFETEVTVVMCGCQIAALPKKDLVFIRHSKMLNEVDFVRRQKA